MTVDQLIAVCEDLKYTLDVIRVVHVTMPRNKVHKALKYRYAYLRDIRKLLES